jgi:hypothetical protein
MVCCLPSQNECPSPWWTIGIQSQVASDGEKVPRVSVCTVSFCIYSISIVCLHRNVDFVRISVVSWRPHFGRLLLILISMWTEWTVDRGPLTYILLGRQRRDTVAAVDRRPSKLIETVVKRKR